jgi:signal transduction histidine kinase
MSTFQKWLLTLVETRKTASTFGAWLGMSATVVAFLVFASYVEPMRQWFLLDFRPALACFVPMMLVGLVGGWAESRGLTSLRTFGILILIGAALFQFFWAALIVLCRGPGAFLMAALFLFTVTFHGYMHRVTAKYPYGMVSTVVAVAAAVFMRPTSGSLALLSFAAPTGLALSVLMGGAGLRMHHSIEEGNQLKQALYYRALNEKNREYGEMSRRVLDLLNYNHDAGNTLSAVFVHAQLLEEKVSREERTTSELERLKGPISTLLTQLERLRTLISSAHRVGDEMPVVETVALEHVLTDVRRECSSLFPQMEIEVQGAPPPPDLTVRVREGETGLHRVLENVLRNACEGNGRESASKVQIAVDVHDAHVSLCLTDDGPGFADTQLSEPPTALATTKTGGHGLGLYNVNELVCASGGALHRRNSERGGAVVEILLRRGPLLSHHTFND